MLTRFRKYNNFAYVACTAKATPILVLIFNGNLFRHENYNSVITEKQINSTNYKINLPWDAVDAQCKDVDTM